MPACDGIANQIELLEEERNSIQQELQNAPPELKSVLLRELRLINAELGRLRQQYRACQEQTPPVARPDLLARTVQLHLNHETRRLGVAAVVKNIGRGVAYAPFRIDIAVTIYRGGIGTSFVQVFEVPAGVALYPEPVIGPANAMMAPGGQAADGQAAADQAAQTAALLPFPGWPPPIFSQEYITEDMIVPLYYRDESPSAVYEIEFLVDSEKQVSESNETNNRFYIPSWWTTHPDAARSAKPFVVEMQQGKIERSVSYQEGPKEGAKSPAD